MYYYLKKFGLFKGIIGFIITVYPFFARFAGLERTRTVPPLDYDLLILYAVLLVMVVLTVYSFRFIGILASTKWLTPAIAIVLVCLAFFSIIQYAVWQEKAIRCGEVQPENQDPITYCVIIGLERSQTAIQNYPAKTDEYMLRRRAWNPEQVRVLWTHESIEKSHQRVIGYYLAIPLLLSALLSTIVLRECIEENWGNP